ncbi:MAG: hypothetical protein K5919_01255 [Clostridiales bacterium]|nr:hypothetical protein [Clostridiales bacterium]
MNFFVEGLQGSGKSTLVQRLSELRPEYAVYREGDYSPVELAWCAWLTEGQYRAVLKKYASIRPLIEEKTVREGARYVVCYTRVRTDAPGFYGEMEQHEIYHGLVSWEDFASIRLGRFERWTGNNSVFECALFQNTVEDMILFREKTDEEILSFFRRVRDALEGKFFHILYLKTEDVKGNLDAIRKERTDDQGRELWFPMMCAYFDASPWAKARGAQGEEGILSHLAHRQALEMRICEEIFPGRFTVLPSKRYAPDALSALPGGDRPEKEE